VCLMSIERRFGVTLLQTPLSTSLLRYVTLHKEQTYIEGNVFRMTKPWDETMKKLIDASPQELLDWLAKGVKFLHFVPTELLKPNEEEEPLRADRYLAVEEDGEQGIMHVEIKSGADANMD